MIYAFFNMNAFKTSNPTVNPVGELSEKGLTYSTVIRTYKTNKGELYVFNRGVTNQNQINAFPQANLALGLVLDDIVTYNTSGSTPATNIIASLSNDCTDVNFGPFILNPIDNQQYPSYISLTFKYNNISFPYHIYLTDDSFINQYPIGKVEFVLPISDLNKLVHDWNGARTTILGLNTLSMLQKVHDASTSDIITGVDGIDFLVVNPTDVSQNFTLPIGVIYNGGPLYCNKLSYIDLFMDYLLSINPDLNYWSTVIPSLQPSNHFFLNVLWKNTAVNNMAIPSTLSNLGSPSINIPSISQLHDNYFTDYTVDEIKTHLIYTVISYKSLGVYILPNMNNPIEVKSWKTVYPDYFLVPISNINYQQMSPNTQNVVALIDRLVRDAEVYTTNTTLDNNHTIITRGNYRYLTSRVGNVVLSVLTRESELGN